MIENRFVILGAGGVGKSSLVLRFLDKYFSTTYKPTIEDCFQHTVQLPDGITHTFEILDTAGSHHFPAMRELGIRSGRGFLLVFSIDSLQSFREAVQLWELIDKIRGPQVPVVFVGNKLDLEPRRQVSQQMAAQTALEKMCDCPYLETSAKCNTNVDEVFMKLLQLARTIEEAQEAMLEEEQELSRRRKRQSSKRILPGRLSCLANFAGSLRGGRHGTDEGKPPASRNEPQADDNQKCVIF